MKNVEMKLTSFQLEKLIDDFKKSGATDLEISGYLSCAIDVYKKSLDNFNEETLVK